MSNDNRQTVRETNLGAESGCGCGGSGGNTGGCGGEPVVTVAPPARTSPIEPKKSDAASDRSSDSCCGGGSCG